MSRTPLAVSILVLTTVFWGSTLILTKILTQSMPVFEYTGIRHLLAIIGFIPFLPRLLRSDRRILWYGFVTGGANFLLTSIQALGLQTVTAGKAGFLTGLNILIVPFMVWGVSKNRPATKIWAAVGISLTGMFCLFYEGSGFFYVGLGEALVIFAAFWNAIQVVWTGIYTQQQKVKVDLIALSLMQLIWVTGLSFITMALFERPQLTIPTDGEFWGAMFYMAVFGTTLPFFFVNFGLKFVQSTKGAIILALEPVFATLFGLILGNERLSWQLLLGGSSMLTGMFIAIYAQSNEKVG
jgi:drug/metabolite transporter (DMT)-like permease